VYFWDISQTYPDNKEILGRYLWPAPGIGPAMAARSLKKNGEVFVRSTLHLLLPEKILREKDKEERTRFNEAPVLTAMMMTKPNLMLYRKQMNRKIPTSMTNTLAPRLPYQEEIAWPQEEWYLANETTKVKQLDNQKLTPCLTLTHIMWSSPWDRSQLRS
jgi:hypothetical protein